MTNKTPKRLEDFPFMETIKGQYLADRIGRRSCENIARRLGNRGLEQRYELYVAENGNPSYGKLYWNE